MVEVTGKKEKIEIQIFDRAKGSFVTIAVPSQLESTHEDDILANISKDIQPTAKHAICF